jgi:hypothetical protein
MDADQSTWLWQVMTANREEPIRGSLSVGLLSDALPLSSADSLFYAVFVVDSDTGPRTRTQCCSCMGWRRIGPVEMAACVIVGCAHAAQRRARRGARREFLRRPTTRTRRRTQGCARESGSKNLTCDMMWTLGRLGQERLRLGGAECRCQAAHLYWR